MQKNNDLLNSVVEITRQRDKNSLEFSLVATLAETVPVTKVSFYRTVDEIGVQSLEEIVHLDTNKNEKGDLKFLWQSEAPIIKAKGLLKKCLNNKSITILPGQDDTETSIYLPMLHNETVIGILMLSSNQSMENYKPIIEGLIKIYENYLFILSESEHDTLTGLLNRRSFDCRLNKLLSLQKSKDKTLNDQQGRRHAITSAPAWLIVVDVDHFKRVNDNFGHMYGDEVLLLLSQEMRKAFRQTDILFRFGGEEFVVILAPTKDEDALSVLERFRKRIANFSFPQVGQVTVSIGYAKIHDNDYPPAVLDKADKALYHAKNNGRNQVHCYETLVSNGDMIEQVTTNDVELF